MRGKRRADWRQIDAREKSAKGDRKEARRLNAIRTRLISFNPRLQALAADGVFSALSRVAPKRLRAQNDGRQTRQQCAKCAIAEGRGWKTRPKRAKRDISWFTSRQSQGS